MRHGKSTILSFIFISLSATFALSADAESDPDIVTGDADILDADVIKIGNQRVILWGVDAPERNQSCYKNGQRWGCADAAKRTLELLAGRGEVTCYLTGEPDPFNRRFGVCESGGDQINEEMVRRGMALAFEEQSTDYVDIQMEAIVEERGLWAVDVQFEPPWEFRRANTPGGYR
ncbi:thermonuclease family protein [Maritimibacter sp. DP07]|uniref:Thermonuclease family protein n=1 Tax=Maritimibacter harenae TaxID=2606218 RepID=A0A845M886_9RHOB|nr:thermonuclease family protein [Maritimibacter harenae]MZR14958.1 thermonuclease family protein [Maritimibacter harenae]